MKTLFILASVMVVILFATPKGDAQQSNPVSTIEGTVNTYLHNRVESQSEGALSLLSFKKTNGYQQDYGVYVIEWQAVVTATKGCFKLGDPFEGLWRDFAVTYRSTGDLEKLIESTLRLNKGTTIRLTGTSTQRTTEKGWRIENFKVDRSQVLVSGGSGQLYVAPNGEFSYTPPNGWDLTVSNGAGFKMAILNSRDSPATIDIERFPFTERLIIT